MHPVLLKIGTFELHTWGVAFMLSALAGLAMSLRRSKRWGIPGEEIINLFTVIIISALLGSRIWYVVFHLEEFRGNWLDIINPVHDGYFGIAGMSMVGGVVLALIASGVYVVIRKLDILSVSDVVAPAFLLGAGITRSGGCFMAGCCFGKPTDHMWGVIFPAGSPAASYFPGLHVWPTQLFAAVLGIAGLALVLLAEKKVYFPGFTAAFVFIYYSLDRFIVDQFRYYEHPQIVAQWGSVTVNVNHLLLAGLLIASLVYLIVKWPGIKKNSEQ